MTIDLPPRRSFLDGFSHRLNFYAGVKWVQEDTVKWKHKNCRKQYIVSIKKGKVAQPDKYYKGCYTTSSELQYMEESAKKTIIKAWNFGSSCSSSSSCSSNQTSFVGNSDSCDLCETKSVHCRCFYQPMIRTLYLQWVVAEEQRP